MDERKLVRQRRAAAQAIGGGVRCDSVADVIDRVIGIQAQDPAAAALGLRARCRALTTADVVDATDRKRTAVRSWFLRGTLHLVAARDARWLLDLLGPVFLRRSAGRYRELGLDEALCERAERLISTAVANEGPLTRAELSGRLSSIGVDTRGQSPFHLIRRAALAGRICFGPDNNGEATFVVLDDWIPAAGSASFAGDAAVVELARRYRAGYGPVAVADFAQWTGLPQLMCRQAAAVLGRDDDTIVPARSPDVRLLPAYDNYLVGYRTRELSVPAEHERRVWLGGGQIRPTATVDGLVMGTWRQARDGAVTVDAFDRVDPATAKALAAEQADVTEFRTVSI